MAPGSEFWAKDDQAGIYSNSRDIWRVPIVLTNGVFRP